MAGNDDSYNSFVNLLGHKCFTKSNVKIEYSSKILELFTDPISLSIMKNPVINEQLPLLIYDKTSIIEWFCRSDKEPLTGSKLEPTLNMKYLKNFYVSLMLLEYDDVSDKLYFHKPCIDLITLVYLMNNILKYYNNRKLNSVDNDKNHYYLDIDFYETHYKNLYEYDNYWHEYDDYLLENILLDDIFTGEKLNEKSVLSNGYFFNPTTLYEGTMVICGTIQEFTCSRDAIPVGKLINKIKNYFGTYYSKIKEINHQKMIYSTGLSFDYTVTTKSARLDGFYISTITNSKYMYDQISVIKDTLTSSNIDHLKLISHKIKNSPNLFLAGFANTTKAIFKIPIVSNYGYGTDFSFLDLSDSYFEGKETKLDYLKSSHKGSDFLDVNLKNTTIKSINFNITTFIGCDLNNTAFIDCSFSECAFYGCHGNPQFLFCKIDDATKYMSNITF